MSFADGRHFYQSTNDFIEKEKMKKKKRKKIEMQKVHRRVRSKGS